MPERAIAPEIDSCSSFRICAMPGVLYPVRPDLVYESVFVVPPLPKKFDMSMTYYNYFNIYFDAQHPPGGRFNQFVPQLMLGAALANSSGPPDYEPSWLELETWHIGAQYFMEYNSSGADSGPWRAAAATGKLVPVSEGELVQTSFVLSDDRETWTLRMAVVGAGCERESVVVAARPFMGLLDTTHSWREYNLTSVGACWENYGMVDQDSFPSGWSHNVTISGNQEGLWWRPWLNLESNCSWAPRSDISNAVSFDAMTQEVDWDIRFLRGAAATSAEIISV